jgi:hypothetical protein
MQALFISLVLTALVLAAGSSAYFICRRIKPSRNVLSVAVLFCLPVLGGAGWWALPLLFFIGLISHLGAWAHRKSTPGEEGDAKSSYRLAVTATLLALPLGLMIPMALSALLMLLLLVPSLLMGSYLLLALAEQMLEGIDLLPFLLFYYFGLLLTPSLTPLLIGMRQRHYAKNGIDWRLDD